MQEGKEQNTIARMEKKKPVHTPIYTIIVAIYAVLARLVFRRQFVGR